MLGPWRPRVPAAKYGVAPHVTLLYPWVPAPATDAQVERLRAALRGAAPFEVSFRQVGRFPGILWLAPEPRDTVLRLMHAVAAAFPETPAYGGQFTHPEPHLTVAKGSAAALDSVQAEVQALLDRTGGLKVPVRGAVVASQDAAGFWHVTHDLPFAGPD